MSNLSEINTQQAEQQAFITSSFNPAKNSLIPVKCLQYNDPYMALLEQLKNCNPEYVFLTTKEVALFLRVSTKKVEADRLHGTGPPFKKVGAKVVYCLKEILTHLDSNTHLNTCK